MSEEETGRERFWRIFRNVRIAILLSILVLVAGTIELQQRRVTSWDRILTVGIYPVAASSSPEIQGYLASLSDADFAPIEAFFQREAARYGIHTTPLVQIVRGRPITELPPALPPDPGAFDIFRWSLALRAYSFRVRSAHDLPSADVEMFVIYHPAGSPRAFDQSLAVARLRLGIVHAEADPEAAGWAHLAISHELLHTAGATDKYDPRGMPVFPQGYAEPELAPLHPQRFCELMGGQVPVSEGQFREPRGLDECVIGPATAAEIRWRRGP